MEPRSRSVLARAKIVDQIPMAIETYEMCRKLRVEKVGEVTASEFSGIGNHYENSEKHRKMIELMKVSMDT